MKDYKLLLTGLTLLLLIIFIGVFVWLWNGNRKNVDPLPIMPSENAQSVAETEDNTDIADADSVLYVQADETLQIPLDDVIVSFEARYPHTQILARYMPSKTLLTLNDSSLLADDTAPSTITIDLIIADDILTTARLSPLQAQLKIAQDKRNQIKINTSKVTTTKEDTFADSITLGNDTEESTSNDLAATEGENDNTEARNLVSFGYAIKDTQKVDGVILTDNPAAISFRNFLLSSTGQDILRKYDYYNIDGYNNTVNDLFKPTSNAQAAADGSAVEVADALTNGK
jgi:ABC-type molybdate transport system substrate-binding protein